MTLEQLRIFVAVAERQHVTAAATDLGLTQSAASAAIANLEAQYGLKLFDRVGRGIALTEDGASFLNEARAVLYRAAAAEDVFHDLGKSVCGTLRIAASQTAGTYWLPGKLIDFRLAHPDVALECSIGNTEQVAAAVHEGAAQLGFIEGEISDAALATRAVAEDQLLLVVGAAHPWADRKEKVRPEELCETAWVLREKGSGTRAVFDTLVERAKLDPAAFQVLMELPSNEAISSAVSTGLSASILSTVAVVAGLEAGILSAVPCDLPVRSFYLITHKSRQTSRSAQAFLSYSKLAGNSAPQ